MRIGLHGEIGTISASEQPETLLDAISTHAPQLIWQQDAEGQVLWANDAYRRLAADVGNGPLFDDKGAGDVGPQRQQPIGNAAKWFDVVRVRTQNALYGFATDVTEVMRADAERREFVRTLGKTFADLATGLAIFDKDRKLAMFNPALLEMTRLPVIFLSGKPRIDTVLDRLREMQMMPEPKNYGTWREQFTAVETGARNGTYCENWSLADGQVFRVTGRPHPEGAFALLFEDISAEVSLTRRFRTEIETGQNVLDALPDAIAVFSGAGSLVMSNTAYSKLWSPDHGGFAMRDIISETALWHDRCLSSPFWEKLDLLLHDTTNRDIIAEDIRLHDGRVANCSAMPLRGGLRLVRFALAPGNPAVVRALPYRATPPRHLQNG